MRNFSARSISLTDLPPEIIYWIAGFLLHDQDPEGLRAFHALRLTCKKVKGILTSARYSNLNTIRVLQQAHPDNLALRRCTERLLASQHPNGGAIVGPLRATLAQQRTASRQQWRVKWLNRMAIVFGVFAAGSASAALLLMAIPLMAAPVRMQSYYERLNHTASGNVTDVDDAGPPGISEADIKFMIVAASAACVFAFFTRALFKCSDRLDQSENYLGRVFDERQQEAQRLLDNLEADFDEGPARPH